MGAVRDRHAMIAGMSPKLDRQVWHFCTTQDPAASTAAALARFEEEEGTTLILSQADAEIHGFDTGLPMARITLQVHSALDGVGLTAAVAGRLAEAGIACNMVAAFHHDHAFVPYAQREEALRLLQDLASRGPS
ncbi:MAG: ACT domain-containing protein [Pseudomonadota bacterium]